MPPRRATPLVAGAVEADREPVADEADRRGAFGDREVADLRVLRRAPAASARRATHEAEQQAQCGAGRAAAHDVRQLVHGDADDALDEARHAAGRGVHGDGERLERREAAVGRRGGRRRDVGDDGAGRARHAASRHVARAAFGERLDVARRQRAPDRRPVGRDVVRHGVGRGVRVRRGALDEVSQEPAQGARTSARRRLFASCVESLTATPC